MRLLYIAVFTFPLFLLPASLYCAATEGDDAVQRRVDTLLEQKAALEKIMKSVQGFFSQQPACQEGLGVAIDGLDRLPLVTAGVSDMEGLNGVLTRTFDADRITGVLNSLGEETAKVASAGVSKSVADDAQGIQLKVGEARGLVEGLKVIARMTAQEIRDRLAKEKGGLIEAIQNNREQLDFITFQGKLMYVTQRAEPLTKVLKELQQVQSRLAHKVQTALQTMREESSSVQREIEYLRYNNPPKENKEKKP